MGAAELTGKGRRVEEADQLDQLGRPGGGRSAHELRSEPVRIVPREPHAEARELAHQREGRLDQHLGPLAPGDTAGEGDRRPFVLRPQPGPEHVRVDSEMQRLDGVALQAVLPGGPLGREIARGVEAIGEPQARPLHVPADAVRLRVGLRPPDRAREHHERAVQLDDRGHAPPRRPVQQMDVALTSPLGEVDDVETVGLVELGERRGDLGAVDDPPRRFRQLGKARVEAGNPQHADRAVVRLAPLPVRALCDHRHVVTERGETVRLGARLRGNAAERCSRRVGLRAERDLHRAVPARSSTSLASTVSARKYSSRDLARGAAVAVVVGLDRLEAPRSPRPSS